MGIIPYAPARLTAHDVTVAIEANRDAKQADMLFFLALCDTYGLTEIAKWLRNVEADLSGARLSPGFIGDPRR